MVLRAFRIGSLVDVFQYDDVDYDSAVETDQPIKVGDPVDPTDAVNLRTSGLSPTTVANIDAPAAELNVLSGSAGQTVLAYIENVGAVDEWTIYAYDDDGPAVNGPYVVDAAGAGTERWIAIGGKYSIIDQIIWTLISDSLAVFDTNQSHTLQFEWAEDEAGANRVLNILVNAGDRTINLSGNLIVSGASNVDQDLRQVATPTFAGLTLTGHPDGAVTVVTQIQAGGGGGIGFQYKDRVLTVAKGIITNIAAESGWNDI